ncbi:hypothetical protein [Natronospora cellulosivora (SeqCode)]
MEIIKKIFGRVPKKISYKIFYFGGAGIYFSQLFSDIYRLILIISQQNYHSLFYEIIITVPFIIIFPLIIRAVLNLSYFKYYKD